MIKMTNNEAAVRLRRAVDGVCANKAEELWRRPVQQATGDEWYLEGTVAQKKPAKRTLRTMAAAVAMAALLAIVMVPAFLLHPRTDATVYLDVNPSIELQIDKQQRVISALADNEDGERILEGMDLKKTDVDVALNAILGAMVRQGYLDGTKNVLLLSVDSSDSDRAARLQQELSAKMDECLHALNGSGLVLSQSVQPSDEALALAQRFGISPGKATLVLELARDWPNLDLDDLAELSMTDLVRLLTDENVNLRDYLEWDEDDQEWDFDWDADDDDDDHDDADDDDDHDDADDDDHDDADDDDDHDDVDDDDDHDDADDDDDHADADDDDDHDDVDDDDDDHDDA
ncbi:MAG: hypothetical protein II458_08385, partial [Oscillospiraceae bacterium]|nr:hypothetical protein [Oscillospiraceae bacterium]